MTWIPSSFDENGERIPQIYWGWKFAPGGEVSNQQIDSFTDHDGDEEPDIGLWIFNTLGFEILDGYSRIDRFSFAQRFWYPIAETLIDGDRVFYVVEQEAVATRGQVSIESLGDGSDARDK